MAGQVQQPTYTLHDRAMQVGNVALSVCLAAFRIWCGFCLAFFIFDYFNAYDASPCFVARPTPDCYPWGMTEGPLEGGSWNYANKHNYLLNLQCSIPIMALAFATSFMVRNRAIGLASSLFVFVVGLWAADSTLQYLYPL